MNKLVKLKNFYDPSDIVYCKDIKNIKMKDGTPFVEVFYKNNPTRVFLVNLDSFKVVS